jgi:hypothetical protein
MNKEKLDMMQKEANRQQLNVNVYKLNQEQLRQLEYMLKRVVRNG